LDIGRRLNNHYKNNSSNLLLQQALKKYGLTNFSIEILEYCEVSVLIEREQYYFNLLKPKYNLNPIAGSSLGVRHSEETKKKISKASKGKLLGENNGMYGVRGQNHPFFGKSHSEETWKKLSLVKYGYTHSEETQIKMSLAKKG